MALIFIYGTDDIIENNIVLCGISAIIDNINCVNITEKFGFNVQIMQDRNQRRIKMTD